MPAVTDISAVVEALADAYAAGPSELLTPGPAARLLGVGRTTFKALADRPGFPMPVELVAGLTHWRRSDLLAWIKRRPNRRTVPARGGRRDKAKAEVTTPQPQTQESAE